MEIVECPECLNTATRMPVLSAISPADNFYQCGTCAQVSHMPKDASAPPVRFNIAPLLQTRTAHP